MNKILYVFLLILLSFGCSENRKVVSYQDPDTGEVIIDTLPFGDMRDFPAVTEEQNIDSLIIGMIRSNCVHDRAIGIGGSYTYEYACFERLCQLLDEDKLYSLTKESNPIIKIYAYRGLKEKSSSLVSKAKISLLNDTSKVCVFSGCMKMESPISAIVQ